MFMLVLYLWFCVRFCCPVLLLPLFIQGCRKQFKSGKAGQGGGSQDVGGVSPDSKEYHNSGKFCDNLINANCHGFAIIKKQFTHANIFS